MPPSRPKKRASPYSVHPSYAMEAAYVAKLKERTGKTIDEWVELVQKSGPPDEKQRRAWLQGEHGLTTNYAWWVAECAAGRYGGAEGYDPDAYVEAMFAGGKAGLRPAYEELLRLALALGPDVKACPCKTIVPLYRKHVFAELKPSTRTRIDLGLALKDAPATGRLLDTGGRAKGDRLTRRIPVSSVEEIDDEVRRWLKAAYDLAGEAAAPKKKAPTEAAVPEDFARALAEVPGARAAFDRLPPSHRREYISAIEEAKKLETRARRVARAVAELAAGQALRR